ncbi:MAG: shikimate kinase [Dehalococcoidia bacterium]|nr:MAG: shikimate kinase [Dehalococcoidia bacterium]
MKTNIALIGFMGTGKTAVGKALAERLDKKFIELDSLIERKAGKTIPEIFNQDGEIAFRELEIEVTKEVAEKKNAVIACGGGVVLNKINIDRLRKESLIVYLTASPKIILKRTSNDTEERPLLKVANPTLTIQELLRFRKPFYERAADIKIDTSKLDVEAIVEQIINKLKEDESFNF